MTLNARMPSRREFLTVSAHTGPGAAALLLGGGVLRPREGVAQPGTKGVREIQLEARELTWELAPGKEFGIGFPLWIDPERKGPEAFGVWGHPSTVLIDRDGRIVGRIRGERDWRSEDARRVVEWLLGR